MSIGSEIAGFMCMGTNLNMGENFLIKTLKLQSIYYYHPKNYGRKCFYKNEEFKKCFFTKNTAIIRLFIWNMQLDKLNTDYLNQKRYPII